MFIIKAKIKGVLKGVQRGRLLFSHKTKKGIKNFMGIFADFSDNLNEIMGNP
jgi:hypothetical protein